ncbi:MULTISPECIES: hypothetical protein [Streptomyces]|uniref:Lipoprotein n=2 Tax=Streptomyces TaxID=1883 RepID=A0ABV9J9W3_9ACTN
MPLPLPPRIAPGPRRRTLLASAAGATLLAGCSADTPEETEENVGATPSVTERARTRAAQESNALLERYDAVLAARPTLAGRLAPLRAEVVRHVEAFGGTETVPPKASPSVPASAAPSVSASPGTDKDALASLAVAERALADRRAGALLEVPGELARLLASVAAAGAAHAYLLTEGTTTR